ncbi:MAG TPA: alcohol dehydrogenase [Stellaceae bacterium]|nr:alcohol dehydrogenase [Stellaceae bacterium]
MHSMAIVEWGQALKPMDTPNPAPRGTEVLVRVTGCGVCHSDIHIQDGVIDMGGGRKVEYAKLGFPLPHTLGHEIVGIVEALGPDATGAKIGDKRVVFPWIGCGQCDFCKRGEELLCANGRALGVRAPGGYADHVLVPHPRYLVDFTGVPEALAATYACSGLTAYSALKKLAHLGPEETIVIIGAGGVGLSAVMIAPAAVKARIVVADIGDRKRDAALKAGASAVYDNADKDALKELRAATRFGAGAAGAIDFVGAPATAQFGVNALRRGGTLVEVGLAGGETPFGILTFMQRMLTIAGSYVGSLEELKELMALVKAGKVPPIPVATRPLKDVNLVLDDMRAGKIAGRVVVTP